VQLLSLGLNFQSAPLELRERIAFSGPVLDSAIVGLQGRVSECFILSTCNRTELYALVGHAETGAELLRNVLCEKGAVSPEELAPHLYIRSHEEAVKHLFLVASGVQSMVPGEDQILAQLKDALERANALGALGPIMHRLGSSALAVGKRVRSETGISRHSLSVVSVALQLASERLGPLTGKRVVVVGAGQTAELALKHLSNTAGTVTVVNRTADRGAALAQQYGAVTAPREQLAQRMADADLVLSCTSAPTHVINRSDVADAMAIRQNAPLLLFDLAVPRDIEASAGTLPDVTLWDIDHLQGICAENRKRRTSEIQRVEELVDADVEKFMAWWRARQVTPTIQALLAQAETIQEVEISRMINRLSLQTEREKELIRTLVSRVVNKLLHRPVTLLKEDPEGANMAQVVQHLFGLTPCSVTHTQAHGASHAALHPSTPVSAHPAASTTTAAHESHAPSPASSHIPAQDSRTSQ
jgi:glutamyl-tRNA reductase